MKTAVSQVKATAAQKSSHQKRRVLIRCANLKIVVDKASEWKIAVIAVEYNQDLAVRNKEMGEMAPVYAGAGSRANKGIFY